LVIILGLGFTGGRLARRLLGRGVPVWAPVRGVERFGDLAAAGAQVLELTLEDPAGMRLPANAAVVVTIPPLAEPGNTQLHELISGIAPRRVIYISSTGVYGDQAEVDAETAPLPADDRGRRRLTEEQWISAGPWTSIILRAAAIYGPGRGVHASIRQGKLPRGIGSGVTSRIHVDDLAAIADAGIFSDVQGAWPVADDMPCPTDEIVRWCRESLHLGTPEMQLSATMAGRKVDGRGIRELLRVELRYPSWQSGIAASLAEEEELSKPPVERQSAQ
jgi:nucleoside-diphosphate-sugar epimerase